MGGARGHFTHDILLGEPDARDGEGVRLFWCLGGSAINRQKTQSGIG